MVNPGTPSTSLATSLEIPEGICVLTYDTLDVEQIRTFVSDNGAGANLVFIGTTRNSFEGKHGISQMLAYYRTA